MSTTYNIAKPQQQAPDNAAPAARRPDATMRHQPHLDRQGAHVVNRSKNLGGKRPGAKR